MAGRKKFPWYDETIPHEERISLIIKALTLNEKVSMMMNESPEIPRLGIGPFHWWNEACHGVARAGRATVFPQGIGLGATFDEPLIRAIGEAISTEGRVKHAAARKNHTRNQYLDLTYWTPNINLFRDPRWSRGQETFGECPYLTGKLGAALIRGIQGDDPFYYRATACAKHFFVHSGPESQRHTFNAVVSQRDLFQSYARAFHRAVTEAKVEAVMGAYNRTNGEPCCGSVKWIQHLLRETWGFKGHFVSDFCALVDFFKGHQLDPDERRAAVRAVKAGCDLNAGWSFQELAPAVKEKLVDEAALDEAVTRLLRVRMRLGEFDDPRRDPYHAIPSRKLCCKEHHELSLKAAREGIVLLKNNGILPLKKTATGYGIFGPNAASIEALLGNYNGHNSRLTTVLEGIVGKVSAGTKIVSYKLAPTHGETHIRQNYLQYYLKDGACAAAIAVVGLTEEVEYEGGDRPGLALPESQMTMLKAIKAEQVPIVLVVLAGSPIDLTWAAENCDAILYAWYPGEAGGEAVAEVLFGDVSPSGRLPVTMVKSVDDLPPETEYAMAGRTYRYAVKEPLYPFGFGLSYTSFRYSDLVIRENSKNSFLVSAAVTNTGKRQGDEVVQLYLSARNAPEPMPLKELAGFTRVTLPPGETRKVSFLIERESLYVYNEEGVPRVADVSFDVWVGGGQQGFAPGVAGKLKTRAEKCQ